MKTKFFVYYDSSMNSYMQIIVDKQMKSVDEPYIFLKFCLDIQDTLHYFCKQKFKIVYTFE